MGLFDFSKFRKPKQTECAKSSNTEDRQRPGVCDIPLDAKYTPENITSLGRREIFVFGSNLAGHHAGGAARVALNRFGAVWGQGEGLQGNSYAISTILVVNKISTNSYRGKLLIDANRLPFYVAIP